MMAVSHIEKLPNAPLQEVIFELLWVTENDEQGFPVHQFWKGENEWPVVQIGPGILVVND
jgi:hypothetical protein